MSEDRFFLSFLQYCSPSIISGSPVAPRCPVWVVRACFDKNRKDQRFLRINASAFILARSVDCGAYSSAAFILPTQSQQQSHATNGAHKARLPPLDVILFVINQSSWELGTPIVYKLLLLALLMLWHPIVCICYRNLRALGSCCILLLESSPGTSADTRQASLGRY